MNEDITREQERVADLAAELRREFPKREPTPEEILVIAEGFTRIYRAMQDLLARCTFEINDIPSRNALLTLQRSVVLTKDLLVAGRPAFQEAIRGQADQIVASGSALYDAQKLMNEVAPEWEFDRVPEHFLLRWTDADGNNYQSWKIPVGGDLLQATKAALFDGGPYTPEDPEEEEELRKVIAALYRPHDDDEEEDDDA